MQPSNGVAYGSITRVIRDLQPALRSHVSEALSRHDRSDASLASIRQARCPNTYRM